MLEQCLPRFNIVVFFSSVQRSALHSKIYQFSTVQCSVLQYNAALCISLRLNIFLLFGVLLCSTIQRTA